MDLATNITGSNKNHAATNQQQLLVVANSTITIYKECLKNHAASLGGHALDGCGEFMPAPISSPANPTSLKCAACGCHRNFHRRDPDDPCPIEIQPLTTKTTTQVIEYQPLNRHHPPAPVNSPSPVSFRRHSPSPPSPPPISSSYYPSSAPQMLLALSSGGAQNPPRAKATATTPPTVQIPAENAGVFAKTKPVSNSDAMRMMAAATTTPNGRKRFRTKFTSGQKEKMQDFAERVGWKMQKCDEETVASLCKEIGVDRGVLKVWMHNNKSKSGDNHHQVNNQTHVLHNNVVVASATNGSTNNNSIVRTNNVLAVDINSLNINHSAAMHNNLNNHNNGGAIGGLGVHVNGNSYHHNDDDEDESEEDNCDTSPHLGGHASSSS